MLVGDLADQMGRRADPLAMTADPEAIAIATDELERALADHWTGICCQGILTA